MINCTIIKRVQEPEIVKNKYNIDVHSFEHTDKFDEKQDTQQNANNTASPTVTQQTGNIQTDAEQEMLNELYRLSEIKEYDENGNRQYLLPNFSNYRALLINGEIFVLSKFTNKYITLSESKKGYQLTSDNEETKC